MKEIYDFTVSKKVKKQVEEQTENGKLLKEVEEESPIRIIFKDPSRAEMEEANSVSAIEYSESVRKGIITKPLLERFYDDKGGFLAENYEKKRGPLLAKLYEVQNDYFALAAKDDKTPEDHENLKKLAADFAATQQDIRSLETSRSSLFQNTAEARAQTKTVFWYILFLTYIQENEDKKPVPFFKSASSDLAKAFLEKQADYDAKAELNDPFINVVVNKMYFFVNQWFLGYASTREDFKQIEDVFLSSITETSKEEKQEKTEEVASPEEPKEPVNGSE